MKRTLDGAAAGRGGAVFLVGESGIGKSRLAAAAVELAYAAGMPLLRGRASTVGPATPFRPLAEAILSVLRTESVNPADLGPYGPILSRLMPDWGSPSAAGEGESLVVLAEALLRLTGRLGRDRGALLVLDDLHDADPETLAVLEYLVDNIDQQPTALVAAVRDTDSAALRLARAAAQRGRAVLLDLGRLTRRQLRELAASCLDTDPEHTPDAVVDLLWAGSLGIPYIAEELVGTMVEDEMLTEDGAGWSFTPGSGVALNVGLAWPLARRLAQLTPRTRELLAAAAVFGRRFPLSVVQQVTGLSDRDLMILLQGDVSGHLVTPDEQATEWYEFHHQLGREAVLTDTDPAERVALAGRMADAVEAIYRGLPGEWCEIAAGLRADAGETLAAARLFAEAGQRALAVGAADSAVAALERAWTMLADGDQAERAEVLERLVLALTEAGHVDRALAAIHSVTMAESASGLGPRRRAHLHTRLAWAAALAGHTEDARRQVEMARALLGVAGTPEDLAPIDVVEAHLTLDRPGADQLAKAERLARSGASVAESIPLPVTACQAWQLLGAITRDRDPDEATACLERAQALAVRYGLPIWEIHALIRLGNDDALRNADLRRLERARDQADHAGAVTARYQAEASIALHTVLAGDYRDASSLITKVGEATRRLRLLETTQYVTLLSAVMAGHQGDRASLDAAVAAFVDAGGDPALHTPRVRGLARAFCALLNENHAEAQAELDRAAATVDSGGGVFHLSGKHGLRVLLRVLSGAAERDDLRALTATRGASLRWDRQFIQFADAVLHGREGHPDQAEQAMSTALQTAAPYAMSRHLGLRLVADAALADGWGEPVQWLRTAEDHFHRAGNAPVASACRGLLRRAGVRVHQRRTGTDNIPADLRSSGITAREHEILGLLVHRLGNREIAARLHLSPRTVERHISSLLAKTGMPNRIALGRLAINLPASPEPAPD